MDSLPRDIYLYFIICPCVNLQVSLRDQIFQQSTLLPPNKTGVPLAKIKGRMDSRYTRRVWAISWVNHPYFNSMLNRPTFAFPQSPLKNLFLMPWTTYYLKILSRSTTWGESLAGGSLRAQSCPCVGPWITPEIFPGPWQETGCLDPGFGLLWASSVSLTYLAIPWGGQLQFTNNRSHLREAGQRLSLAGRPTGPTPAVQQAPGGRAAQQPQRALGFSVQETVCGRRSQTRWAGGWQQWRLRAEGLALHKAMIFSSSLVDCRFYSKPLPRVISAKSVVFAVTELNWY